MKQATVAKEQTDSDQDIRQTRLQPRALSEVIAGLVAEVISKKLLRDQHEQHNGHASESHTEDRPDREIE